MFSHLDYVYRILPLDPICPEEYLSLYQIPEFLKKVYINIYGSFSNCSNFYSSQTQKCPGHCFGVYCLTYRLYVNGLLCYYGLIFSQSELICRCIYFLRFAPVTHDCLAGELIGPLYGICVLQLTKTNRLETAVIFI